MVDVIVDCVGGVSCGMRSRRRWLEHLAYFAVVFRAFFHGFRVLVHTFTRASVPKP